MRGGRTGIEPAFTGSRPALFPDEKRPRAVCENQGRGGRTRTGNLPVPNGAPYRWATPRWWVISESNRVLGGFSSAQSPDLLTTRHTLVARGGVEPPRPG